MQDEANYLNEQYVNRLGKLTQAIESGDEVQINGLMSELTTLRESSLYQELGRLTREIHETINTFGGDDRIASLANDDIPDAKERLNFIVTKTDESAHKTMNAAEATMDLIDASKKRAEAMKERWKKFRNRELSKQEFITLSDNLDSYLKEVGPQSDVMHGKLTDIMMAQDYQDITGQMIKQIVNMVQEIEEKLVRLVAISGAKPAEKPSKTEKENVTAEGPQLPGADKEIVASTQGDVDDLLASLGF